MQSTLANEINSIMDLMKEVDLCEKETSLAKEEASEAGLDTLAKVKDLKEMLKYAEEANNMVKLFMSITSLQNLDSNLTTVVIFCSMLVRYMVKSPYWPLKPKNCSLDFILCLNEGTTLWQSSKRCS